MCGAPNKHEGETHKVQDWSLETILLWIDIGHILLRVCPCYANLGVHAFLYCPRPGYKELVWYVHLSWRWAITRVRVGIFHSI